MNIPRSSKGFTLIEIMVASGLAAFAVATTFTFARFQISAFRTQTEVAHMNASSSLLFQQLHRDLGSISAGSSFWVGVQDGAFSGVAGEVTFTGYGLPSIRPTNNVSDSGPDITDPMPGSDIITLIRFESDSTFIPGSAPGETHIPPVINNLTTGFTVADPSVLACANRHLDNDGAGDGLLLISNMAVNTAASFMLAVTPMSTGSTFPGDPGPIFFADLFNINPSDTSRGATIVPTGAGPGSQIVCARPVAYWIDRGGRLRLWRATTSRPAGLRRVTPSGVDTSFVARIDPERDIVLAEGIEELQLAYLTNSAAVGRANRWVYGDPALGPAAADFGSHTRLAEIRAVRVSAIIRTARRDQVTHAANRPAILEDKTSVSNVPVDGCDDPLTCYDSRYLRRTVRFMSELRNLRFFDLMTDPSLLSNDIRSFVQ